MPATIPIDPLPDQTIGLLSTYTWGNYPKSEAVAWVKWGAGNSPGKFRKPLVFVEGIDFGCNGYDKPCNTIFVSQGGSTRVLTNQELAQFGVIPNFNYRNGQVGWNEMVAYNPDDKAVEKLSDLRAKLTAQGYDIIFLDFTDGATFIERNAMTLVELLQWINDPAHRTSDAQETIVAAASMGGQVARFALAWMEQQKLCHNAKLYVSIDSPHRGANIPLGVQALIQRLRDVVTTFGQVDSKWASLERPAAVEMLVYHIDGSVAPYRNAWQNWQKLASSYPTLLRKVAIASGNGHGTVLQKAAGGSQYEGQEILRTKYGGLMLQWGDNRANSLAGAASDGHDNVIFRYTKPLEFPPRWHYVTVPGNTPRYDIAPGGTRTTTADAQAEHPNLFTSGSDYQTFIPTISSLDVSAAGSIYSLNLFYDVKANIPDPSRPSPSKYAFEAYYAPDGISEPHINITNGQPRQHADIPTDYTSDNSDWILNELAESAHNLPGYFDSATHYPSTLYGGAIISPYNFGSLYRRLLPTIEMGYGGKLFVNNNNLPISGGATTANAQKETSFEMYTSSCGSRVVVSYNGNMTLGQPNDTHTATVNIGLNSLVDLRYGGQLVVNAGSTLRIKKEGTLIVRAGSALLVYGKLLVDAGAFICIENPNSITVQPGGEFTTNASAYRHVNPALGVTASCTANYPPCTSQLWLDVSQSVRMAAGGVPTTSTPGHTVPADTTGQTNFDYCSGLMTVTAQGEGFDTDFTWTVNGLSKTPSPDHPDVLSFVVHAGATYDVVAQVHSTCDGSLLTAVANDVQGSFPNCRTAQQVVTMYPNPASGSLSFELPAGSALSASAEYMVSLYDGQGMLRWQGRSNGGKLHLASGGLPRGIYGVVIQQGPTVTRRNLSLERFRSQCM